MSSEFSLDAPPAPAEMESVSFALAHNESFQRYLALRVQGVHSTIAFRHCFPLEWAGGSNGPQRINAVEFNPWMISSLRDALATINPQDLWNPRIAIHSMKEMANNPFANDNSRLGAMKELNVLLNITVTDENGKTKAGRSLDDFYSDLKGADGPGNASAEEGDAEKPAPKTIPVKPKKGGGK